MIFLLSFNFQNLQQHQQQGIQQLLVSFPKKQKSRKKINIKNIPFWLLTFILHVNIPHKKFMFIV
jgi:hypothetical protein